MITNLFWGPMHTVDVMEGQYFRTLYGGFGEITQTNPFEHYSFVFFINRFNKRLELTL